MSAFLRRIGRNLLDAEGPCPWCTIVGIVLMFLDKKIPGFLSSGILSVFCGVLIAILIAIEENPQSS
jgi:hypothetical protein